MSLIREKNTSFTIFWRCSMIHLSKGNRCYLRLQFEVRKITMCIVSRICSAMLVPRDYNIKYNNKIRKMVHKLIPFRINLEYSFSLILIQFSKCNVPIWKKETKVIKKKNHERAILSNIRIRKLSPFLFSSFFF